MEGQAYILTRISEALRNIRFYDLCGAPSWDDAQFIRSCKVRVNNGDSSGWQDFLNVLRSNEAVRQEVAKFLDDESILIDDWESVGRRVQLPSEITPLLRSDEQIFLQSLEPKIPEGRILADLGTFYVQLPELYHREHPDRFIEPKKERAGQIMYIEMKPGLSGPARIGRVRFSKTRKTIYYDGKKLQSLKGNGFKANYYDVESAMQYWVSNCKKDGNDTLYGGIVEIDDDVREEYWTEIRQQPENKHLASFRSPGKYSKRRPS
jgi:hypothetical protein